MPLDQLYYRERNVLSYQLVQVILHESQELALQHFPKQRQGIQCYLIRPDRGRSRNGGWSCRTFGDSGSSLTTFPSSPADLLQGTAGPPSSLTLSANCIDASAVFYLPVQVLLFAAFLLPDSGTHSSKRGIGRR